MRFAHLLLPATLLLAQAAQAEVLEMGVAAPGAELPDRPARGSTMAQVQARFGAPAATRAAVGKPPITRWEYSGFVVFFEHDKVLHSVTVRPAPAP